MTKCHAVLFLLSKSLIFFFSWVAQKMIYISLKVFRTLDTSIDYMKASVSGTGAAPSQVQNRALAVDSGVLPLLKSLKQ